MFVEGNRSFSLKARPLAKTLAATLYMKGFPNDSCPDLLPSAFKKDKVEKYRLQTLGTHLGDKRVSALLPSIVCKYRDTRLKTVSPASLKRGLTILSSVLNIAIKEWGIVIGQNPVSMVSLPKITRGRDRRLVSGEEEKLLSSSGELKRLIIVSLETGMHRGKVLNIKKSHIDFTRQTLLIPLTKTDTPRTIPFIIEGHSGA
jgi:integrase